MYAAGYDDGEILGGMALQAGLRHHEELIEDAKECLHVDQCHAVLAVVGGPGMEHTELVISMSEQRVPLAQHKAMAAWG